ncbi:hypothetical protein NDU88_005698 [Pleurodeles waltl]|uniref:Uncharacterized protein n=1 Tax=Pleurodeles waltl TaxID=8319 RepID=A0AAV7RJC8_PLEWA|nr:hypothetical protein NDU88_005698 [Pleurodeles waltl]
MLREGWGAPWARCTRAEQRVFLLGGVGTFAEAARWLPPDGIALPERPGLTGSLTSEVTSPGSSAAPQSAVPAAGDLPKVASSFR